MMKVKAPQQLLELVAQNSAALNRIHIVAALNKAAELWPSAVTGTSGADSEMVLGRQQLQQLVKMLAGPFARR
jgi:type IV secretory pathway VirB2 component (pilin)